MKMSPVPSISVEARLPMEADLKNMLGEKFTFGFLMGRRERDNVMKKPENKLEGHSGAEGMKFLQSRGVPFNCPYNFMLPPVAVACGGCYNTVLRKLEEANKKLKPGEQKLQFGDRLPFGDPGPIWFYSLPEFFKHGLSHDTWVGIEDESFQWNMYDIWERAHRGFTSYKKTTKEDSYLSVSRYSASKYQRSLKTSPPILTPPPIHWCFLPTTPRPRLIINVCKVSSDLFKS